MEKIALLVFIDDDFATNFYHKIIVRESGLVEEFIFFATGQEALAYFEALALSDNPKIPDSIFLDINMPGITGWEFLELYALIDVEKSPIFIMLTTLLNSEDHKKGELNPLVYGYKNKPLTEEHLMELQQELV